MFQSYNFQNRALKTVQRTEHRSRPPNLGSTENSPWRESLSPGPRAFDPPGDRQLCASPRTRTPTQIPPPGTPQKRPSEPRNVLSFGSPAISLISKIRCFPSPPHGGFGFVVLLRLFLMWPWATNMSELEYYWGDFNVYYSKYRTTEDNKFLFRYQCTTGMSVLAWGILFHKVGNLCLNREIFSPHLGISPY